MDWDNEETNYDKKMVDVHTVTIDGKSFAVPKEVSELIHAISLERDSLKDNKRAHTDSNIVFYCKGCSQMFYAGANDPDFLDEGTVQEIADLLHAGHRMFTVDTATVRRLFNGCMCANKED